MFPHHEQYMQQETKTSKNKDKNNQKLSLFQQTDYLLFDYYQTIDKYRVPNGKPDTWFCGLLSGSFLGLADRLVNPFLVEDETIEGFVLGLRGEGDHVLRHLGRVLQTFTRPLGDGGELLTQCQRILCGFGGAGARLERVSDTSAVSVRILTLGETVKVAPG